jgi:hypothetical protein
LCGAQSEFAVGALSPDGHQVDDDVPANIWPIDGELAQLDAQGCRPLHVAGPEIDDGAARRIADRPPGLPSMISD